tara:strand:- start:278 stop:409 length:132 start_codon:yes stop_codon:yes gene_type:complete
MVYHCFYQDEELLKPIEIDEAPFIDLKEMMKSTEFKKDSNENL